MSSSKLIIAGARNSEILRLVERSRDPDQKSWELVGFADDQPDLMGKSIFGVPVLARFDDLGEDGTYADCYVVNNVGSRPENRRAAADRLDQAGCRWATLIDHDVEVEDASIAEGTLVFRDAIVSAGAKIGRHCYVNFGAKVTHDAVIGDYCILAPDARVMARVTVGSRVYLGAGCVIVPDCIVEDDAVVGALALATRKVGAGETIAGNPARTIFRKDRNDG